MLAKDSGTGSQGLAPYIGDNCNWWVGEYDTGVFASHKNFDGVICRACGNIEGMVALKGGTFSMGQDGIATPVRSVTVSGFKMARYQVTQELYFTVMENNPSEFNGTPTKESAAGEIQGKRPVDSVYWYDALDFCNKLSERGGLAPVYAITNIARNLSGQITFAFVTANWNANGYRLPTEAEWEYACRAGTETEYSFGAAAIGNYAWYDVNAGSKTHQVGLKLPNAFGLYDMHGNVREWCWDRHDTYQIGDTDNPKGPVNESLGYRVLRGGSWSNVALGTRSAIRGNNSPTISTSGNTIGFRLVRR